MKKREIKKITDEKKIEALYREGKISKTTFWRAKKRGWIAIDYHKKNKLSEYRLADFELIDLYYRFKSFAYGYAYRWGLDYVVARQYAPDLAGEALVHILEIRPRDKKEAARRGFIYIKQLAHKDKRYRRYFFTKEKELERALFE